MVREADKLGNQRVVTEGNAYAAKYSQQSYEGANQYTYKTRQDANSESYNGVEAPNRNINSVKY